MWPVRHTLPTLLWCEASASKPGILIIRDTETSPTKIHLEGKEPVALGYRAEYLGHQDDLLGRDPRISATTHIRQATVSATGAGTFGASNDSATTDKPKRPAPLETPIIRSDDSLFNGAWDPHHHPTGDLSNLQSRQPWKALCHENLALPSFIGQEI